MKYILTGLFVALSIFGSIFAINRYKAQDFGEPTDTAYYQQTYARALSSDPHFFLDVEVLNIFAMQGEAKDAAISQTLHFDPIKYPLALLYSLTGSFFPIIVLFVLAYFLPLLYGAFITWKRKKADWALSVWLLAYAFLPTAFMTMTSELRTVILIIPLSVLFAMAVFYRRSFWEQALFLIPLLMVREEALFIVAGLLGFQYLRDGIARITNLVKISVLWGLATAEYFFSLGVIPSLSVLGGGDKTYGVIALASVAIMLGVKCLHESWQATKPSAWLALCFAPLIFAFCTHVGLPWTTIGIVLVGIVWLSACFITVQDYRDDEEFQMVSSGIFVVMVIVFSLIGSTSTIQSYIQYSHDAHRYDQVQELRALIPKDEPVMGDFNTATMLYDFPIVYIYNRLPISLIGPREYHWPQNTSSEPYHTELVSLLSTKGIGYLPCPTGKVCGGGRYINYIVLPNSLPGDIETAINQAGRKLTVLKRTDLYTLYGLSEVEKPVQKFSDPS